MPYTAVHRRITPLFLYSSLAQNKYITYLGIRFLADGIRHNSTLLTFNFRDNIGTNDQGASMFAEAIRENETLEEFE